MKINSQNFVKWYENSTFKIWIDKQKQKVRDWFKKDKNKEESINKKSSNFFAYIRWFLLFFCIPIIVLFFITIDYQTINLNPLHWKFFKEFPVLVWISIAIIILFLFIGPHFSKLRNLKIENKGAQAGLAILLFTALCGIYAYIENSDTIITEWRTPVLEGPEDLLDKINIKKIVQKHVLPQPNVPISSTTGDTTGPRLVYDSVYTLKYGERSPWFWIDKDSLYSIHFPEQFGDSVLVQNQDYKTINYITYGYEKKLIALEGNYRIIGLRDKTIVSCIQTKKE